MAGDPLARAAELERAGEPHALATVVRVDRPVSARVGDRAVVLADGRLDGWVGGSCTAPVVTREALAALADGGARLVRIRPPGSRTEPDQSGVVTEITTCASEGGLDVFVEPRLPRPLLVVVGSSPVARSLAELARVVGHRVTAVVDGPGEHVPGADATLRLDQLGEAHYRAQDAVVVATMNRYDEPALAAALASGAGYVGLVASRRRGAATLANLEGQGVDAEAVGRVRTPAGFDLGPATQEEIALAVLAEVVAERNRTERGAGAEPPPCQPGSDGAGAGRAGHPAGTGAGAAAPDSGQAPGQPPRTALDPVCGMTVAVTPTAISATVDAVTAWFCGPGCRDAFLAAQGGHRAAGGH
jgi:xanthine dehydrogenase accessory factor